MKYETLVQELRSKSGQRYLGVNVQLSEILPYIDNLRGIVSSEEYTLIINKQKNRDKGQYHLTLITPDECQNLSDCQFTELVGSVCDLDLIGLGRANKLDSYVYYVVCNSNFGNKTREILEFRPKDFHITLGFNRADMHDVTKDSTTILSLQYLSK